MGKVLHPGVYVEETRSRSIIGTPTGVAGFVRENVAGPAQVSSYASLEAFERDHPRWDAARSFFEEGGKRLLIAPAVISDGASVAAALTRLVEADIVAAPGMSEPAVAHALIAHAETHRSLALIDPPPGLDGANVRAFRAQFDSGYAALYWPWIVDHAGRQPPSPAIAGIFARSDAEHGIGRSSSAVVRTAVCFERMVNNTEQEVLNPLGINCLRSFPGRGNLVWGVRTMSNFGELKYVPVRRHLNWLQNSIEAGLAWTAFEANDERLWATIRSAIAAFLQAHWRTGGLQGVDARQAYFVRCDATTMTPTDILEGRLVVVMGVALQRPAEFIHIRIVKQTAGRSA